MPTQKRREITSRIFQPFKDIVRTPDRGVQSALLSPDPTPLKRKALTSEPSSPTSTRRPRKRPNLALPLRLTPRRIFKFKPAVPVQLPSPPAPPSPSPLAPADTGTALDAEPEYDSDSASHQSSCETSPSTDTLAPDQSSARASARAHGIDTRVGKDRAAANRVLKLIKEFKSEKYKVEEGGSRGKYLVERKLHLAGYKLLLEKLEEDTLEQQRLESKDRDEESLEQYVKHRLHFDYIHRPRKGERQFVIHMPSHFHERMAGGLSDVIVQWYGDVKRGNHCTLSSTAEATKGVASRIGSSLATRVKVNRADHLEPDLSFTYDESLNASLVIEVAWSQSNLELPKRADDYIKGRKEVNKGEQDFPKWEAGQIRTVVGLNFNDIYNGGRRAWFSVWNARFDRDNSEWTRVTTVDHQMFIDDDGKPVQDCELPLSLKDFVSEEEEREIKDDLGDFEDVPLKIPSTELHRRYEIALRAHVCVEIGDEKEKISSQVREDLEKILDVETRMQETKVHTSGKRKIWGPEDLAKARDLMKEIQGHIKTKRSKTKVFMGHLEGVGGSNKHLREAKEKLAEAEKELADLEKKMEEARAKLEREAAPESEHAALEDRTGQASETNAAGPSVPQSTPRTPVIPTKPPRKTRLWPRKK